MTPGPRHSGSSSSTVSVKIVIFSGCCPVPGLARTMNGAPLPLRVSPCLSLISPTLSQQFAVCTRVVQLQFDLDSSLCCGVNDVQVRLGTRGVHSKFDRLWCPIDQLSGCPSVRCVRNRRDGSMLYLLAGWAGPSWSPRPHCFSSVP